MEVSLLHQLHDAQQQQNEAVETSKGRETTQHKVLQKCKSSLLKNKSNPSFTSGLKLELERAEEKFALKEMDLRKTIAGLAEEKSKILSLSMERARVIQVMQCLPFALNLSASCANKCLNTGETGGTPAFEEKMERGEKNHNSGR